MAQRPLFSLSPRLTRIADFIPRDALLADVGSDHAYLPIHLLREGRIRHAIAADISQPCIVRARANALRYRISSSQLDVRLSDGLRAISPDEADTIVIAGMGGETIVSILEAAPWVRLGKLLLLQPASKVLYLREWCMNHALGCVDEVLVREDQRFYPILALRGDVPVRNEKRFTVAAPPLWERDDPLTQEYFRRTRVFLGRDRRYAKDNADILAAMDERIKEYER